MLIPVIISGGAGTRLWPVSREARPKPFIRLPDGESLLQKTYLRIAGLAEVSEMLTVTNRDYYFQTKDELQGCDIKLAKHFLLEPMSRNTAPAITLAALQIISKHGSDTKMLVLPADHLIANSEAFLKAVDSASELADAGYLVTFGIQPTAPESGFGYIDAGEPLRSGMSVKRFVEKPDAGTAKEYLEAGNFFWNSGMFCFRACDLIHAIERLSPEVYAKALTCWEATNQEAPMTELDPESFARQPDISIDYAVMEKADNVAVVPCDLGWSDIGSWNALGDLVCPDAQGNRSLGDTVLIDTRNTFIQSEHHLVAAVGVDDLVIIDTPDAVLVTHKDKTQDVKKVVSQLKQHAHQAYRLHRTVQRPWGTYTVLEEGPRFQIKRIEVRPGASLSLQIHHHRSEHWIVVSGIAKVINGEREFYVNTNESTYIPAGHKHRLENTGLLDLVMIEVQSGDYLGEDDIVRFDDVYGRVTCKT